MNWAYTLYRYLGKQFLLGVLIVLAGFLLLAFSIDIVNLLNRTAGHAVTSTTVVMMALLQLPDLGQKMLPFAVLLGGVYSFVRLSHHQELVVSRAAGLSAWDFLLPPLVVAVVLGILHITVITPVASRMLGQFSVLEAKYIKNQASQLSISKNGLWLRQGDTNSQSVIHALHVSRQGTDLKNVIFFLYGPHDSLTGRIDAERAELGNRAWKIRNAYVSNTDGVVQHYDTYRMKTTLTRARIMESFAPPETLSLWELPSFIRAAEKAGFTTLRYRLYLYTLLAQPILFAAMVFMAASFSLRVSRSGGIGRIVLIGALCGFGVYFFSDLTTALGRSGILPPLLAATAPALAAILVGMTLVFHQEDG